MKIRKAKLGARFALAVAIVLGAAGVAVASSNTPASNAVSAGHGIDEFGMTKAFMFGNAEHFTYTKGFFCDTSVAAAASSGCEAGETYKTPPSPQHDTLYITVPLGFDVPMNMQDCPAGLVCVDHPGSIDLTRLEPALKPLYPQLTDAQLNDALKNFAVPGHDHFITDDNNGLPEWWDVQVIGVTNAKTYDNIRAHRNFSYIRNLVNAKDPNVVGPIPTNLFLFFSVQHDA